jgi:hypothetical protein
MNRERVKEFFSRIRSEQIIDGERFVRLPPRMAT